MKTLGIIFAVLLVLLGLALFGLQMFLTKGLTTALNQGVFPAVKGMYGLEMSITNASVNLFKGSALLEGFSVSNLKGYEEPTLLTFDTCRLDLDMMSLLKRDPVVIKLAEADGAVLTVERNKQKLYNVKELADALKPVESKEAAPKAEPTEPAAKAKPVPVHIRRIAINSRVKYIDSGRNRTCDLNLRLTGSDLFTVPAEGQPDSLLVLRGSLAHDKDSFATDLNAILKPLTDPKNPSFNATGSVLDISADFIADLLKSNDMESSSFSIKPSITCTEGRLKGSYLDLVLNDLKVYGASMDSFSIRIPIKGTIQKPVPEFPDLQQLLLSEQGLEIGKILGLRELKKQLGVETNATPRDLLIGGLTNNVKEIQKNPALKGLIELIVPDAQTNPTVTNQPSGKATRKTTGKAIGNELIDQLGKNVKELDNDSIKDSLQNFGTSLLFGTNL
ncbi:MAG: hypothetical protein PHP93_04925 [Kiritimatiellales bacterium]|nr:hypothetical protein [Kiritimatiellales bacterium]